MKRKSVLFSTFLFVFMICLIPCCVNAQIPPNPYNDISLLGSIDGLEEGHVIKYKLSVSDELKNWWKDSTTQDFLFDILNNSISLSTFGYYNFSEEYKAYMLPKMDTFIDSFEDFRLIATVSHVSEPNATSMGVVSGHLNIENFDLKTLYEMVIYALSDAAPFISPYIPSYPLIYDIYTSIVHNIPCVFSTLPNMSILIPGYYAGYGYYPYYPFLPFPMLPYINPVNMFLMYMPYLYPLGMYSPYTWAPIVFQNNWTYWTNFLQEYIDLYGLNDTITLETGLTTHVSTDFTAFNINASIDPGLLINRTAYYYMYPFINDPTKWNNWVSGWENITIRYYVHNETGVTIEQTLEFNMTSLIDKTDELLQNAYLQFPPSQQLLDIILVLQNLPSAGVFSTSMTMTEVGSSSTPSTPFIDYQAIIFITGVSIAIAGGLGGGIGIGLLIKRRS